MPFRTVAVVGAVVSALLGIGWLFAGRLQLRRWRLVESEAALVVGRRLGVVYTGLAVMCAIARDAPLSSARDALAIGAALICGGLAGLGTWEWRAGRVGPLAMVSVALEVALAVAFASTLRAA